MRGAINPVIGRATDDLRQKPNERMNSRPGEVTDERPGGGYDRPMNPDR